MKALLVLALAPALRADDATAAPPPSAMPPGGGIPATPTLAPVDEATVTHQGYPSARYEALWTKSPFAVETPETAPDSPDYSLVGIATVEGVSYISLIEKGNSEHFLLSSDKPDRGLTLTSVTPGKEGADTFATVIKDGAPLTLKLEAAPMATTAPNMPGAPGVQMPTLIPAPQQQIPMPGSGPSSAPGSGPRPLIRIHRPPIHVPPRPNTGQDAPAPAPAPASGTAAPAPVPPPR